MAIMSWVVKHVLMPGSVMLLVLGLLGGAVMLTFERTRRRGRQWLTALAALYWVFSTPVTADALASLVGPGAQPSDETVTGAGAIVVLDGGTARYQLGGLDLEAVNRPTAFRALEAARVYRALERPVVIVTGGAYDEPGRGAPEGRALAEALVSLGIPADRIALDTASRSTREHAINVGSMLRERGITRFVLVTSATHIRRSVLTFRAQGLSPVPRAAALRSDGENAPMWQRWIPEVESLFISEQAMYECLGLAYYYLRGWL